MNDEIIKIEKLITEYILILNEMLDQNVSTETKKIATDFVNKRTNELQKKREKINSSHNL